jgi:mono/diheme cytochrome c family protein
MPAIARKILKIIGWALGSIAALVLLLVLYVQLRWDAKDGRATLVLKAPTDSASIFRGEYIYKYQAQCWGCHHSSAGDATGPPSGGMLFDLTEVGPGFGKWYSRNLTPDGETGLGGWTDGEIVQAMREGISRDHTTLFPIMPLDWYHGMADEDALAVVAYLRSLPAIKNAVPAREPSFVAKALMTFKIVKPKEPLTAPIIAPPRGVTPEYGKYVSSHLADCADCHTPRSLQDGHFYLDSLFAGGSVQFGMDEGYPVLSYARNLTHDIETGIGRWSEEDFVTAVTTGMRPDSTVLSPIMPYAYYKSMNPDDIRAIYIYLKGLRVIKRKAGPNEPNPRVSAAPGVERGKLLFHFRCQSCHGKEGGGALPTNVKLAEVAPSLEDQDLIEFVSGGQLNLKMPAFGKTLTTEELKDIVAYIRTWETTPGGKLVTNR